MHASCTYDCVSSGSGLVEYSVSRLRIIALIPRLLRAEELASTELNEIIAVVENKVWIFGKLLDACRLAVHYVLYYQFWLAQVSRYNSYYNIICATCIYNISLVQHSLSAYLLYTKNIVMYKR